VEECLDKAGACERASERDELLRRAAALCRGSFLAGEMEPWAAPMRERIRNRFQGLAALRSH
jgi:hypothetical protein